MLSQQPPWLESILGDRAVPPRLYAWSTDNLVATETHKSPSSFSAADDSRRIYILGLGNLGRLIASSLANSPKPPPITLVVHKQELLGQWLHGHGIEIARAAGVTRNKNFDVEWWTENPPTLGPIREVASGGKLNNLIVATKASAALPSADRVRRYLNQTSTIAFIQNGVSKLWPPHGPQYASHRYPEVDMPNFLSCVVTHGVFSQGSFSSVHASEAGASIGPVLVNRKSVGHYGYLMQQMAAAPHLNVTTVSQVDLWIRQLEKVVVNSIITPLTAVLRKKNGALFIEPHPDIVRVVNQLLKEASQVLQALLEHESSDIILTASHGTKEAPENTSRAREELVRRFSQPQLAKMLYQVGVAVKDNKSSMLQDVEAGKTTEIRDFNGWLTDMALFLSKDLDVSTHQKLIQLVEDHAIMEAEELSKMLLTE